MVRADINWRTYQFSLEKVKMYVGSWTHSKWNGKLLAAKNDAQHAESDDALRLIEDVIDRLCVNTAETQMAEDRIKVTEFFSDVLDKRDRRTERSVIIGAKIEEIKGLMNRGAFETVDEKIVPTDTNLFGGRFMPALKNLDTADEEPTARYIAQVHKDCEKYFVLHSVTSTQQKFTRLIIYICGYSWFQAVQHWY